MSVDDVEAEIRSVFKQAMSDRDNFPYTYLQATGCGSRSLTVPSLSTSFDWTAQQVAKLGGNKGTVYIMAEDELKTLAEVCVCVCVCVWVWVCVRVLWVYVCMSTYVYLCGCM